MMLKISLKRIYSNFSSYFHTYLDYGPEEKVIMKASKEICYAQLINLRYTHKRLGKSKQNITVGFESVYYAEVRIGCRISL
ncbi:MAG: hypothetical protein QW412_03685 [Candidatus Aenigmatarchaeota archaeon]